MFNGKKPSPRGGNVQREGFAAKASAGPKAEPRGGTEPEPKTQGGMGGESGETRIEHHGDGTHTVHHADGEKHENVSMGHAITAIHAKHEGGEGAHIHAHGGTADHEGMESHHTVTTHHHGHDGEVQGPHHHGSMDEAMNHVKQNIGEDGGNGAVQMAPSEMPGEGADLY